MGGEIKVDSVWGQGTTFSVTIPQKIDNINILNKLSFSFVLTKDNAFSFIFDTLVKSISFPIIKVPIKLPNNPSNNS